MSVGPLPVTFAVLEYGQILVLVGALLVVGIAASLVADRLRVPGLIVVLGPAMLIGSDVLGLIRSGGTRDDVQLARTIGVIARRAVARGRSPALSAALASSCTWSDTYGITRIVFPSRPRRPSYPKPSRETAFWRVTAAAPPSPGFPR